MPTSGAPNDSFLLNALKTLLSYPEYFQISRMHSKRYYKICICSVIQEQLESFRNYKGLSIIFLKILSAILSFTKVRIFLIPLSITFSNPKILGFFFL